MPELDPSADCAARGRCDAQLREMCSGLPLRLVWAIFSSSVSLIDIIDFEAPLSFDLGVSPRLADRAAPAAFCWAADLAGIGLLLTGAADCGRTGNSQLRRRVREPRADGRAEKTHPPGGPTFQIVHQ